MRAASLSLALAAFLTLPMAGSGAAAAGLERLMSRDQALALAGKAWGHSAAGQYLAGRLAQAVKDYGNAADYLEGALAWDPNNLELRRRVFLLLLAEGRLLDALPHARPLSREGEGAASGLPTIAQAAAAMRSGDFAAALAYFSDLDNNGLTGLIRLLGQAWAGAGAGDIAAARAALTFSAEEPAWGSIIALHRALIEDVTGNDAIAAYAEAEAGGALQSSRAADFYANFQARQADTTVAPIVAGAAQGFAEGLFSIAAALNRGERAFSALIYAQLGVALAPKNDLLRLLVAEIAAGQNRYEDAAALYDAIPKGSPYRYDSQISRARYLAWADKVDAAIATLKALATAAPDKAEAQTLLGDVLRREARFDEAVIAYDEAARRLGDITADHWRLLYHRGIALERAGDWPRAESDLLAALRLQGDQAHLLNYLGYSWIDRGENLERAEEMIRRAVELRPEDGFIVDSLGWVYYRTGRYGDAVRELERAVTLEPLDPTINEHLGDAYWQVGRLAEARFQWGRALNLEPDEKQLPVLEEKLRCGLNGCAVAGKAD